MYFPCEAGIVIRGWTIRRKARTLKGKKMGNDRLGATSHEHHDGRHCW